MRKMSQKISLQQIGEAQNLSMVDVCVFVCMCLHGGFLVTGVHQSQGVPDHTHFNLFVNRTGDVFKNSRCHLENRGIRQHAAQCSG